MSCDLSSITAWVRLVVRSFSWWEKLSGPSDLDFVLGNLLVLGRKPISQCCRISGTWGQHPACTPVHRLRGEASGPAGAAVLGEAERWCEWLRLLRCLSFCNFGVLPYGWSEQGAFSSHLARPFWFSHCIGLSVLPGLGSLTLQSPLAGCEQPPGLLLSHHGLSVEPL